MGRKLTLEIVTKEFLESGCTLLSKEYKNAKTLLNYICACGNPATIRYDDFRVGKRCKNCANTKLSINKRIKVEDAQLLFEQYNYKVVGHEDVEGRRKFIFKCPKGHIGSALYHSFQRGQRCTVCGRLSASEKLKLSIEEVRKRFEEQDCELLSKEYVNWNQRLTYRCSCGNISQTYLAAISKGIKCGCQRLRGELSPQWNPLLTEEERLNGRNYPEYREWLKSVYDRDDYTCSKCNARGCRLNAHHILNYSSNPEMRTEISNGITLCEDCHKKFHRLYGLKGNNEQQLYNFLKE